MDTDTLGRLLEAATAIARDAGRAILAIAREGIDVRAKSDGSPLTRADLASERVIASGLAGLAPTLPVLSEEGDAAADCGTWRTYWCVDPLDGTKEFVKGLTDYTVNIAVVEDGAPILGVIDAPAAGATYYAAKGLGAWRADAGREPVRIAANPVARLASAVVSRSHLSDETRAFLERLGIERAVDRGSSLKICAVAEGASDVYPRHGFTCLWDTAAGTAIATEAGCKVIDLEGEPLRYDPADGLKKPGFIVAPVSVPTDILV